MARERALSWIEDGVRRARYSLHSRRPYSEVQVPLTFRNGMPFVQASWGGRKIECLVDTGTGQIMWPQWLRLKGKPLHLFSRISHLIGQPTRAEWVVASDISLGGFTIRDLTTLALDVPLPSPSSPQTLTAPILGLQAFNGVIMTIDYARRRLILRDGDFFLNVSRQPHRPHARLTNFPPDDNSLVTVSGTLAGHKALFLLDTGCYYPGLIGDAFARKYLQIVPFWTDPRKGIARSGTTGKRGKTWYGVRNLAGSVIGQPFKAAWMYTVDSVAPGDVILGSPWFMRSRVTIDQFRNVVLIEPNEP